MTKYFMVELAIIAVIILTVIYRKSWVVLGRIFQWSFFATLLFTPAFSSNMGYGFGQLSNSVSLNIMERMFAIMGNPFGALQYALLLLAIFCATAIVRNKHYKGTSAGWITYIVLDVLLFILLTEIVYDHSHSQFSFG